MVTFEDKCPNLKWSEHLIYIPVSTFMEKDLVGYYSDYSKYLAKFR